MKVSWELVADLLVKIAERPRVLDDGQRSTLHWIAEMLKQKGSILADEVGTGKTRIACACAEAVVRAGGRVAVVVPPGLMHQWAQEWRKLQPECDRTVPKRLATFVSYVGAIVEDAERKVRPGDKPQSLQSAIDRAFPCVETPEVWLLSHNLRAPQVRIHGDEYRHRKWQHALPSFVHAQLARSETRNDGRTSPGRILRKLSTLTETRDGGAWSVIDAMATVLAKRIDGREDLAKLLAELPLLDLREGSDNRGLAEAYRAGQPAQIVFDRLLGRFLGQFDLIIVDEAHKSRGGVAASEDTENARQSYMNVLTRLLERMLESADDSRRIGLTATPLELSGSDWDPLLRRTLRGTSGYDIDVAASQGADAARALGREAHQLRRALQARSGAPIPPGELDALCAAGKLMTKVLKPHVTRRRRTDDKLHQEFRRVVQTIPSCATIASSSRPHRRSAAVTIDVMGGAANRQTANDNADSSLAAPWTRVLFSMESLGQSLRGYLKPADDEDDSAPAARWLQTAYTRLAGGQMHADHDAELQAFIELVPAAGDSIARQHHRKRIVYWIKEQQSALTELHHQEGQQLGDPLWSHPRIVGAVELIEQFTKADHKVLVFGTFRAPMRALAWVLEVRHALRSLADGKPVAVALGQSGPLAWHEIERMRRTGFDQERVLGRDRAALEKLWNDAHRQYERLRERIRRRVRDELPRWLDGHKVAAGQLRADLRGKLERIATPFVVDMLLYAPDDPTGRDANEKAHVKDALGALWTQTLEPALDEIRDPEKANEDHASAAVLLAKAIELFDDSESQAHDTHHVRQLHGGTGLTTRHLVQAKFNRPYAAPHVLVAQSRVGREGLNLHESCRVVVQFNAEWNPAILEQQIGRVDRKGSLWERLAQAWIQNENRSDEPPFIEVRQLTFAGTYDDFQWETVKDRQYLFDATLYGELLPAVMLAGLDEKMRARLVDAAPDFRPPVGGPSGERTSRAASSEGSRGVSGRRK